MKQGVGKVYVSLYTFICLVDVLTNILHDALDWNLSTKVFDTINAGG